MCGILGWVGKASTEPDIELFADALDLIRHRGPDGGMLWADPGVRLGHRRLAIIDLDHRSDQPMFGENLALIFNGELYNFRELRSQLQGLGHTFSTTSDSEVMLRAWIQWGIECLSRLEGMFAFGIWDKQEKSLTLARDRFGEKPLFVHEGEGHLAFSSELPPLIRLSNGSLEEDHRSTGLFFLFSYIPAPRSIFKKVRQLEPGCWLRWSEHSGIAEGRFYHVSSDLAEAGISSASPRSYSEAQKELRNRLKNSVKLRVESADVPVATLISGGIDSSIITTLAAQVSEKEVSAYSLGFPEDPEFDETEYARIVTDGLPTVAHKVINATETGILEFADQVLDRLGEPYADASILPTSLLCKNIEEKVALGGDGADELFAGYGVYPAILRGASLPGWARRMLLALPPHSNPVSISNRTVRAAALFHSNLRYDLVDSYVSWRTYASIEQLKLFGLNLTALSEVRNNISHQLKATLRNILMLDIEYNLPNDMLKKVDYAGMAHGLEVRLPFLDSQLVHWALGLPDRFMVNRGTRKRILKDAFRGMLPRQIIDRGKKGFLLPIRKWFRGGRLGSELNALLSRDDFFDVDVSARVIREHIEGVADNSVFLWSQYVYLRWQERRAEWARHRVSAMATTSRLRDGSILQRFT
ncbi:MAG: asparagine synthase (glutamine-hydrolyzing) [Spirochaetaceae bacterium]|nr:asparagine synthase (glutamine-hydrolyzing) [Spirochaetaceae bacterium]|tara:strand:- start:17232 stop:19163 length:1932 start_codon:yes stop_codon:yes gene_type:complete